MSAKPAGGSSVFLRVVRVTIAEGKTEAYWTWSKDIVRLWDEAGVKRAGGPYAMKGERGEDVALWLTVHDNEEQMRSEFQELYGSGWGKELIEVRPGLVAETQGSAIPDWNPLDGAAPPAPPRW